MSDRNRRARSPVRDPARASLQSFNYGTYPELHAIPTRREIITSPRVSTDRGIVSPVITTTYKITGDPAPRSGNRADSRTRRSTLESNNRPAVFNATPRRVAQIGRPSSPLQNPYRSSDEGDVYAIPASSLQSSKSHKSRPSYNATYDNGDFRSEAGVLRANSGRNAMYRGSRPRSTAPTSLVRHPDTMADDYGDDGYGYTNPRDLVQYDLARSAPRYESRRDSYGEPPRARPTSIGGMQDLQSRKYDSRGPPPSSRGFDRIPRQPMYEPQPPSQMPQQERREPVYEDRRPRPVSLYQDDTRSRHGRDEYRDRRDDDLRRDPNRERYDDDVDRRAYGKSDREEPRHRHRDDDRRRDDYDEREKEKQEKKDRRRDTLSTVMGIAGAALGIGGLANAAGAHKDDSDRDSDERERRRRKDRDEDRRKDRDEEPRRKDRDEDRPRRKDSRDEDYSDKERRGKDSRKERTKEPETIDLSGRNPQEKQGSKDSRDFTPPSSREESPPDTTIPRHHRLAQAAAPAFNPKDTMDLRALKDALNRQDAPPEAVPIPVHAGSKDQSLPAPAPFNPRDPQSLRNIQDELQRSEHDDSSTRRKDSFLPPEAPSRQDSGSNKEAISIVPPPTESTTVSTSTAPKPAVKGILRPPREKFPEDANPIREGVAPLKDSKKDGIPPDARWTKIARSLVNPEALELGKERFEARDDCVIVLRVLTKEEIQGYAEVTQKIRRKYYPFVSRIGSETTHRFLRPLLIRIADSKQRTERKKMRGGGVKGGAAGIRGTPRRGVRTMASTLAGIARTGRRRLRRVTARVIRLRTMRTIMWMSKGLSLGLRFASAIATRRRIVQEVLHLAMTRMVVK